MFNQIIVVEGTHDEAKIKEVFKDANCVITNGSEISKETLKLIEELAKTHEIIIFTDPDSPGERIRSRVLEVVPNARHAFIMKKKCISANHKKVGVEHATKEDIYFSLSHMMTLSDSKIELTMNDLLELRLTGYESSKPLRDKISESLNMGHPNAKTFLNRCRLFGITKDKLKEMVGEING